MLNEASALSCEIIATASSRGCSHPSQEPSFLDAGTAPAVEKDFRAVCSGSAARCASWTSAAHAVVADREGAKLAWLQARSLQQETLPSTSKPWKSWHGAQTKAKALRHMGLVPQVESVLQQQAHTVSVMHTWETCMDVSQVSLNPEIMLFENESVANKILQCMPRCSVSRWATPACLSTMFISQLHYDARGGLWDCG